MIVLETSFDLCEQVRDSLKFYISVINSVTSFCVLCLFSCINYRES